MNIYKNLYNFATDRITGEGWDAANKKAEKWRDALEEMLEIASPLEQNEITALLTGIRRFFEHPANNDPWYYLKRDEPFLPGDEAFEVNGNIWFPIVDSVGNTLNDHPTWALARRLKVE